MYFIEGEKTIAFLRILEIGDTEKARNYCSEVSASVQNMQRPKLESFHFYKTCQDCEVPRDKHIKAKGRGGCHSLFILGIFLFTTSGITFSLPMTHHMVWFQCLNIPHPRGKANSTVTVT